MATPFEIVPTPTFDWLDRQLQGCTTRFLVASPFVGSILTDMTAGLAANVEKRLVTRTDVRYFAAGASSAKALCDMAANSVSVNRLAGLHAKVYVVDDKSALVTSANATYPGLKSNRELGLATSERDVVAEIAGAVVSGFGAEDPPEEVTLAELNALGNVARVSRPRAAEAAVEASDEPAPIEIADRSALLENFSGWRRHAIEGILTQPKATFTLDEVEAAVKPLVDADDSLTYKHPTLRRVLQEIRDLGLLEFVDYKGTYRRTFEVLE